MPVMRSQSRLPVTLTLVALLSLVDVCDGLVTRVKDIATISGVSEHKLMGYGLVVGLAGSRDSARDLHHAVAGEHA